MSRIKAAPVDLNRLARFTGGDAALDAEILSLFVAQSAELMPQLEAAANSRDETSWRRITHSLKGAARGIGALALGDAAADAEALRLEAQSAEASAAVRRLTMRVQAVSDFVRAHLADTAG